MKKVIRKSLSYYKSFNYTIIKKFSVQDRPQVKDYSKHKIYFYIIQENTDLNRFLFISTELYEEKTFIHPNQFKLKKPENMEEFFITRHQNEFNDTFFEIADKKCDKSHSINLRNICMNKLTEETIAKRKAQDNKELCDLHPFFSQFKCHTKRIAFDNPNWYKEFLLEGNIKDFKKMFEKHSYCQNDYDDSVKENYISTLFSLKSNEHQILNDHSIHLDEGKTGKSSMISWISNKCDNISIAGLYGSSNSQLGKFQGGLVTTTKNSIIVDELNELSENTKNDKILSILNTFLENGVYNYVKQFSAEIQGSNQFIFLGNITEEFDFSIMLENLMGNNYTFGRRIGIITYNANLRGYKKGLIRGDATPYVLAIKDYLSKILNYILNHSKFYTKTIHHRKYLELESYYKKELNKLIEKTENETIRNFIKSHSESIGRQNLRALKLYIFSNMNLYITGKKPLYEHLIVNEVLDKTKIVLDHNIENFKHMVTQQGEIDYDKISGDRNKKKYDRLFKVYQDFIDFFYFNKKLIDEKGANYDGLKNKQNIKKKIYNFKKKIHKSHNLLKELKRWGCLIRFKANGEIIFHITNLNLFEKRCIGIFDDEEIIEVVTQKVEEKKEVVEEESLEIDEIMMEDI